MENNTNCSLVKFLFINEVIVFLNEWCVCVWSERERGCVCGVRERGSVCVEGDRDLKNNKSVNRGDKNSSSLLKNKK